MWDSWQLRFRCRRHRVSGVLSYMRCHTNRPPPIRYGASVEKTQFKGVFKRRKKRTCKPDVRIEIQGKRFSLKYSHEYREPEQCKARGPITCFSRKARAARLRRIAEINWKACGPSTLVTLTYPDAKADHTMEQRKNHRYLINRRICLSAKTPIPCIWRVEWMPRLSGAFIGQLRPHMHLLYLGTSDIQEPEVEMAWTKIIGAKQRVQVDVRIVIDGELPAVYAAKYCSKEASEQYLDIVPKWNRTGRHAGELRKELIPVNPLRLILSITDGMRRFLQNRACDTLWWYDPRFDEGFTILGEVAKEFIEDVDRLDWTADQDK